MHEFSIANSIVEVASEHARIAGAERITRVTLRIGALSCVHRSALEFCFELATKETMLEAAELMIIDVPVTIFCAVCDKEVPLAGIQRFSCPICDTPSADIRQGNELDVDSIEVAQTTEIRVN